MGAIAAVVGLLVVGGGGWFGWSKLRGGAEPVEQARSYDPVEIPTIPAELEPQFRALADAALQDWVAGQGELGQDAGLPEQPPADWLAGVYLGSASQYQSVADYWSGLSRWLEDLRGREEQDFRQVVQARMDSAGVASGDREPLLARAVAGFRSALPERDGAYDALAAVSEAALELHEWLVEHEQDIEYVPQGLSADADPVLEARPLTPALGDQMWGLVDDITSALDGMGALTDRVTTERLVNLTLQQLGATSVH